MKGMKAFKVVCLVFIFFILLSLGIKSTAFADDCINQPPSDAPNLYQVMMSSSSASLYFAQPATTFDGYIISYGLTPSADSYSVGYQQGNIQGANKYIINDLFPKTNYYFKVRAVNGCAAGPWSQILSTNIKGAESLPATGPQDLFKFFGIGAATLILTGLLVLVLSF